MPDINGVTLTGTGGITYAITYIRSRPDNSQMTYNFTIVATLAYGFLDNDYAMLCTITVNGVAGQVRIKSENEFWYAGSRTRNLSVTCPSTVGNTVQPVRFQVISDSWVLSPGVVDNSDYTVTSSPLLLGPPTSLSLRSTVAEGVVYIDWAGAISQPGNTIESYEFQYSDSPDNATWEEWVFYIIFASTSTNGSTTVPSPPTRGHYRRYRVRVRGTAGEDYYSPWKISSNSVQRNVLPISPSTFTARPDVYSGNQVTLQWSGTIPGTSTIRQYVIEEALSHNQQVTWSNWGTVATVNSTSTSGSIVISAITIPGVFTRYRINVMDSRNAFSEEYTFSNVVLRHDNPLAPLLEAPRVHSTTYNRRPMYLIQTEASPKGIEQAVYVFSANAYWLNSVDNPECFSKSGTSIASVKTIFTEPEEVSPGSHVIEIQCRDEFASSPSMSGTFNLEASPFEEIVPGETHVKAAHILTLRTAINNLRYYYRLLAYVWPGGIIPGRTQVRDWPLHVLELRAAIQGIIDKINSFDNTAAPIEWLPLGVGRPRADVMNQIMDLVLRL